MNFLTIFKSRSLSGLLCLVFSISTLISLQLNEINDYVLNPFMVIIIAAVSLVFFVNRHQGIFLLSICFANRKHSSHALNGSQLLVSLTTFNIPKNPTKCA